MECDWPAFGEVEILSEIYRYETPRHIDAYKRFSNPGSMITTEGQKAPWRFRPARPLPKNN